MFSIGIDGKDEIRLTYEGFYNIYSPSLSPDGNSMIVLTLEWDASQRQVVIYPEQPRRILRPHFPVKLFGGGLFESPNYTPDGKSVLFMAAAPGKRGYDYDLYRMDLGNNAVERLTLGNGYAGAL